MTEVSSPRADNTTIRYICTMSWWRSAACCAVSKPYCTPSENARRPTVVALILHVVRAYVSICGVCGNDRCSSTAAPRTSLMSSSRRQTSCCRKSWPPTLASATKCGSATSIGSRRQAGRFFFAGSSKSNGGGLVWLQCGSADRFFPLGFWASSGGLPTGWT